MIYGFLAIVASMACSAFIVSTFSGRYSGWSMLAELVGVLICIIACVAGIIYGGIAYGWIAADAKAKIINREYGTNYTQAEVFYADDVIETIRQIKRHRVEATVNINPDAGQ